MPSLTSKSALTFVLQSEDYKAAKQQHFHGEFQGCVDSPPPLLTTPELHQDCTSTCLIKDVIKYFHYWLLYSICVFYHCICANYFLYRDQRI